MWNGNRFQLIVLWSFEKYVNLLDGINLFFVPRETLVSLEDLKICGNPGDWRKQIHITCRLSVESLFDVTPYTSLWWTLSQGNTPPSITDGIGAKTDHWQLKHFLHYLIIISIGKVSVIVYIQALVHEYVYEWVNVRQCKAFWIKTIYPSI